MSEEKNDQKSQQEQIPAPSVKASEDKPEVKPEPTLERKEKEISRKPERSKECVACNKSIKKRWYYRDSNYYCGKGCWKKAKKEKGKTKT